MILVFAALLCVITVPLAGGRLSRLLDLELRATWTVLGALAIQVLITTIIPTGNETLHEALHVATYALAAAFLLANRHVRGIGVLAAGAALNLSAIAANHGVMPASLRAMHLAGLTTETNFANSAPVAHPHLLGAGRHHPRARRLAPRQRRQHRRPRDRRGPGHRYAPRLPCERRVIHPRCAAPHEHSLVNGHRLADAAGAAVDHELPVAMRTAVLLGGLNRLSLGAKLAFRLAALVLERPCALERDDMDPARAPRATPRSAARPRRWTPGSVRSRRRCRQPRTAPMPARSPSPHLLRASDLLGP